MQYKAGFIGVGNMGSALASAVYKSTESLAVCDSYAKAAANFKAAHPNAAVTTLEDIAANARFAFFAVKPNIILGTAKQAAPVLGRDTVAVTIAAGVSLAEFTAAIGSERCIRIMPNTPAAVGQGMILYTLGADVTAQDEREFLELLRFAGVTDKLDEKLIDAAAALSGCGPAYVYMFAEALADGAVRCGVPRDKALLYAKQTIFGSAAMMMQSEKHPEKLKDDVCSPGGTTIEGVLALEQNGFRYAAAGAVTAAYEKTARLKK